jgi:hypothetical protein
MEDKDPHPLIAATLMAFLAFGVLTFISLFFISCNTCERKSSEISILHDWTEVQLAKPSHDEIISLFGLDSNKWNAAVLHYTFLTDVSYNRQTTISLADGGSRLLSSSFTRDKEVQRFTDSIRTFFQSIEKDTAGRPHSSIYLPLVSELTRLAASPAITKILLVYSDLMENENSLSFYDKKTLSLMRTDSSQVIKMLEAKAQLPDLTGIEIHLIFQPENATQDERFQLVSGFYASLLESHGASVTIAANVLISSTSTSH